jgi:hypothetical protein
VRFGGPLHYWGERSIDVEQDRGVRRIGTKWR